ncbi:MAG: hypothetical protein SGPRY_010753 [Prymnesium sp.]
MGGSVNVAEGFVRVVGQPEETGCLPARVARLARTASTGISDPTTATAVTRAQSWSGPATKAICNVGGTEGTEVCVELGPTAVEFRKGSQIRLQARLPSLILVFELR